MASRETLGIDVGGVIIAQVRAGEDTSFLSQGYLQSPEVPGALEAIKQLGEGRFGKRVFLVSKCGPRNQAKTLRWLKHHRFFEWTGVKPKHVRFCLERSGKAPICEDLGITHFVDDRLDVLLNLKTVEYRYLFEPGAHPGDKRGSRSGIVRVGGWDQVVAAIFATG